MKNNALKSKISLIFVSLTVILSIFALMILNGSTAWFADNDTVEARGFSIQAKASVNLIIGKTPEDIAMGTPCFFVRFDDASRTDMIAVTRDESVPDTYLKYLTNHYAVDHFTGNASEGETLEFDPVPAEDNGQYFVDYTICIASLVSSLEVNSLTATLTVPDESLLNKAYVNAVSADFYVGEVSPEGYRGTTSVAQSAEGASGVDLFASAGGIVPLNTDGYITVIMRCYFDGALQDSETRKAYVNSDTVQTNGVSFGVQFVADEKQG